MSTTIPKGGTLVPSDPSFGIVKATDQVGGVAWEANEAAIGALAAGRLVINGTWRGSTTSGVIYAYTSATPAGGFANGTWTPVFFTGSAGSFSPGVATVATTNVTKSGEQTLSGVLTSVSRVLLVGQTAPAEDGLWTTGPSGWTRTSDANTAGAFVLGKFVFVTGGTNAGFVYGVTVAPTTLGTDPIQFAVNSTGTAVDLTRPGPIGSNVPNTVAATQLTMSGPIKWSGVSPSEDGIGISLADTDHTLTSSEYSYRVINLLGPMTSQHTLTWPLDVHSPYWLVRNATTGGFALTIKGGTGTGIDIPPGATVLIWTDANNYYGLSGGGGAAVVAAVKTGAFTAAGGNHYKVDSSGGAFPMTFTATPTEGDEVWVTDVTDSLNTNAVTATAAGSGITVQDWARMTKGATSLLNRIGTYHYRYMGGTAKFWASLS